MENTLKLSLLQRVLDLTRQLLALQLTAYQRPLPHHWNLVTQRYLHPDATLYPATGVHVGVDFAAPLGTPILAPSDGYITSTGYSDQLGNWCEFKFGGYYLIALHLRSRPQSVWVRKGTPIGYVGDTGLIEGIHAHLECWTRPMDRTFLTTKDMVVRYTRDITTIIP